MAIHSLHSAWLGRLKTQQGWAEGAGCGAGGGGSGGCWETQMMLVGSSEKAVMWGTSEPERGAQSRVAQGEHQGEQEAGICWVRTRKMPGWPTLRGQGSQGHTGQVFAGPVMQHSLDSFPY